MGVMVMVFNATFSNISVKSWLSVLLVEETALHYKLYYQNNRIICMCIIKLNVCSTSGIKREYNIFISVHIYILHSVVIFDIYNHTV